MYDDGHSGKIKIKDKKAEEALMLYEFCKEFGWTPNEYYNTQLSDIIKLKSVMDALGIAETEYMKKQTRGL